MHSFPIAFNARLRSCPDGESGQATVRVVLGVVLLGFLTIAHERRGYWTARDVETVKVIGAYLLLAIALLVAMAMYPQRSTARRLVGMVADVGACTWFMATTEEFGFFAIGFYLFIIFSHGFRYGYKYLIGCQLLCLAGMSGVLLWVPFWAWHRIAGGALLTTLVVVPLYVAGLVRWYESRMQGNR